MVEELEWWSNAAGLNGSAHDLAQIVRGLRTLPLRIDRQVSDAIQIAAWLGTRKEVEAIHFPVLGVPATARLLQRSNPDQGSC